MNKDIKKEQNVDILWNFILMSGPIIATWIIFEDFTFNWIFTFAWYILMSFRNMTYTWLKGNTLKSEDIKMFNDLFNK